MAFLCASSSSSSAFFTSPKCNPSLSTLSSRRSVAGPSFALSMPVATKVGDRNFAVRCLKDLSVVPLDQRWMFEESEVDGPLPLIPPYVRLQEHGFMGGANFAGGGSCALVDTFQGLVVNLHTQLKQMEELEKNLRKEVGNKKAKRIVLECVYFICIGSNDYVARIADNSTLLQSISMEDHVGMVIGNITAVLQGIYEVGGRKFAMMGVGPLGCAPGMRPSTRNGTCLGEANELAKLHNAAFTSMLAKLETQLRGFEHSYFDSYTSLSERIQYPSKYGFKVAKTACCGSGLYRSISSCGGVRGVREYSLCRRPEKYMFFDSFLPSERVNQQFAQLMWNGSTSVTRACNLKALFKSEHV